jgi:HK97 family phage major capsid protein
MRYNIENLKQARTDALNEMDRVLTVAETHKRDMSKGEQSIFDTAKERHRVVEGQIAEAEEERIIREQAGNSYRALGFGNTDFSTNERGGIYNPESQNSYFKDMLDARNGNSGAQERLERHSKAFNDHVSRSSSKEVRALTTTAGAGGEFSPPVWLINDYIKALRPARATADILTNLPMPAGTDLINIPKVLTGGTTALQTSQNSTLSSTDITTGSVAAPVLTIAGGQQFSTQLFEQSPMAGSMDQVILGDLIADYAQKLGGYVINGTGTGGQPTGLLTAAANTIAYTDATPGFMGAGKLYAKIGQAIQTVQTARYLSPTAIIMHPRRWAWASVQVDSANRAVILPGDGGPLNASGVDLNNNAQGVVGHMFGLPVIVDPNVPINLGAGTNQDPIIVLKADDSWLYESTIRAEVFQQTYANSLSLYARVYNYMALGHRLSQSIAVINGTGLITPTF